ncbi:Trichothecene efflux pump TRI12 [Exophiala dermatitidis]
MADPQISRLQQLEREHADAGELDDFKYSEALSTDASKVRSGYFISPSLIGALASISLSTVASYWGFSPAAAVITVINADIGPSSTSSLFSIIWTVASAVSLILFGRISDKFGRRWFLIAATGAGFVGGVIAGTAKTMDTLVGANVLLGLGAGVHTCYGLTTGEVCPNKYKFLAVVLVVVPNVIPTGFGAYLALMLTHTASWRWIYYIYLIIQGIALILMVLFYHPPSFRQLHGNERTRMQEIKRIDWVGMFLLVAGLVLFLLGISWGGSPVPWSSPRILGLVISGGITLVLFGFWEVFSHTPNPLIPMHLFKDLRGFTPLFIISAVSGTVYLATAILWPSQISAIYASTITSWQKQAWASTTIAFGIWGGIVILGPFVSIIKHVRIQLIVMMAVSVAFLGALASCNSSNFSQSAAFSFLATFPAGILEVMTGLLVQLDSNDADLAVFVAILSNEAPKKLQEYVVPAALNAGLPKSSLTDLFTALDVGTTAALEAVPGMTNEILAAVGSATATAYAAAYSYVYYAAVAIGVLGLFACVIIKDYDPLFTDHIPRQIYKGGKENAGAVLTLTKSAEGEYGHDKAGEEHREEIHNANEHV